MDSEIDHPIPQNVTSFEFHLIGDMTLRQFGYLASGLVIAYVSYLVLAPYNSLLAFPIIGASVLWGAAFAFFPVFDRPLDHWLKTYLRAIYSPTRGDWKPRKITPALKQFLDKKGRINPQSPLFKKRLELYCRAIGSSGTGEIKTADLTVATLSRSQLPIKRLLPEAKPQPAPALPSPSELQRLVEMANQTQILQKRIQEAEREIAYLKAASGKTLGTEAKAQELRQVSHNLQNLLQQTRSVYSAGPSPLKPAAAVTVSPEVVVIQPRPEVKTQLQLTSFPNVINGIVTDSAGNYLEGVIVIIHNKDNLPVRALKTNKLGQFSGATPLPDGIYTLTFESENLEFATLQITLEGRVLAPLKVTSRRKGTVGV